MDGKVFVITGTTSGTGFVAAWVVAELGGEVLLLNRPSQRVTDSMEKLKETVPDGKFSNWLVISDRLSLYIYIIYIYIILYIILYN